MKGSGIIDAYHTRRVAPRASLNGSTLADEALPPSKVAQRIKEVMEPSKDDVGVVLDFVYPVPGYPPMRPEPGYIDFVSSPFLCLFFN